MTRLRQAALEATTIALVATVLGFTYTSIRGKGIFATEAGRANSPAGAGTSPTMIHLPEARSLFDSGKALFIDARHRFEYSLGHIPGALNIPISEFDEQRNVLDSIPKDKILITYCDGVECNSSINLATRLHESGFLGVKIFFAGWNEWRNQNLPTEEAKP